MRVELSRRPRRPETFLLMIALLISSCSRDKARAETRQPDGPPTTMVIFTKSHMTDSAWTALFGALQKSARNAAEEMPALKGGLDLVRGDTIAGSGRVVEKPISVYLRGECRLYPVPQYKPAGTLGWVWRVHGRIEPFIYVDCQEIAQQLGPLVLGMNRQRRETVMGEALARVIVHEWVHVATQNPGHASHGVAKSSFGIADLLAEDAEIRRDPRLQNERWKRM